MSRRTRREALLVMARDVTSDSDSDELVLCDEDGEKDEEETSDVSSDDSEAPKKTERMKQHVRDDISKIKRMFAKILVLNKGSKPDHFSRGLSDTNILMPPSIMEEYIPQLPVSPIKMKKYFGTSAREDFMGRINVAYKEDTIKGTGLQSAFDQTAFLPSKEEYLDIPFYPRRPIKKGNHVKKEAFVESLGDVSCLDGYDDRPAQHIDAPSTICSLDHLNPDDFEREQCSSPRTAYISGCIQEKIHPRASLLLRKSVSKELNLQHQGMGDSMGIAFALSLKNMPFLESINLTDNNLTDKSLHTLIGAFQLVPALTYLNLSHNEINRHAATALATYVASNSTLTSLVLCKADLDDYECQLFVAATTENVTLTELDLSNNEIGKSEISPVLRKRNGSGAEALSAILSSGECHIRKLNLRWNQIRRQGAASLVSSLELNESLLHLDLGYNSLGNAAAEILGSTLLLNRTLQVLLLDNNNIQGSGCFTICVGILENFSLNYVSFDNNPLSELGADILMQLPLEVGNRMKLSAKNCNFARVEDSTVVYDPNKPASPYDLDLSNPFHRAVAIRLLHFVATTPKFKFSEFQHRASKTRHRGNTKYRSIHLKDGISREKEKHMSEDVKVKLENLKMLKEAAGDIEKARILFNKYDADGNDSLDAYEMQKLLEDINVVSDIDQVKEAIRTYDIDGAGTIELGEFCLYLNAQADEAETLIRQLCETKIFVTREHPNVKYVPPKTGKLHLIVSRDYSNMKPPPLLTKSALTDCVDMIMSDDSGAATMRSKLLEHCIKYICLNKREAVKLFFLMKEDISDTSEIMAKILSRISTPKVALDVMSFCLPDPNSQSRLRNVLGYCLNPFVGIYNGYFEFNLLHQLDRDCLARLIEVNEVRKNHAMSNSLFRRGVTGDLSQKGDWSNFRNGLFNGQPFLLSAETLTPMPHSGVLSFDFCGSMKPNRKSESFSNRRCINSLINVGLFSENDRSGAQLFLRVAEQRNARSISGLGNFSNDISKRKSRRIQYFMLLFYGTLTERSKEVQKRKRYETREKETVVLAEEPQKNGFRNRILGSFSGDCDSSDGMLGGSIDSDSSDENSSSSDESDFDKISLQMENFGPVEKLIENKSTTDTSTMRKKQKRKSVQDSNHNQSPHASACFVKRSPTTIQKKRIKRKNMRSVKKGYKQAEKLLREIVQMSQRIWLKSSQLALIVNFFSVGKLPRYSSFGNYRVDLICILFNRVLDIHNFDLVVNCLSTQEIACVYCRVGILNIFNPIKPEGWHCLNMSMREERLIAKVLILLSVEEPGKNWREENFRWKFDVDPIPGWKLPSRWMTDKHVPYHGFLHLEYYCGREESANDGNENENEEYEAAVPLRKSLFYLVYIEEEDIINDEANFDENGHKIHKRAIKVDSSGRKGKIFTAGEKLSSGKYAAIWNTFLTPLTTTSVRITDGAAIAAVFEQDNARIAMTLSYSKMNSDNGNKFTLEEPSASSSKSNLPKKQKPKRRSLDFSRPSTPPRASFTQSPVLSKELPSKKKSNAFIPKRQSMSNPPHRQSVRISSQKQSRCSNTKRQSVSVDVKTRSTVRDIKRKSTHHKVGLQSCTAGHQEDQEKHK